MIHNLDLLFSQEIQEPSLTFWLKFAPYSVDSHTNQHKATSLKIVLPTHLVQGIFSCCRPRCTYDSITEALLYHNKPDVANDWHDIRLFTSPDREDVVPLWEHGQQSDLSDWCTYSSYIKLLIKDGYVTTSSGNVRLKPLAIWIPLPVTEGNCLTLSCDYNETTLKSLGIRPGFYIDYDIPIQQELCTLYEDGSAYYSNCDISKDRMTRCGYGYLTLVNLPIGNYVAELYINKSLLSRTSYLISESSLPCDTFSLDEINPQFVPLDGIAYSLLVLSSYKRHDILTAISDQITNYINKIEYIALPNKIARNKVQVASDALIDVKTIALIVYGLVKAASAGDILNVRGTVAQLVNSLVQAIDLRTNLAIGSYSLIGAPLSLNDLEATLLVNLSLNSSLGLYYNTQAHYITARTELKLLEVLASTEELKRLLSALSVNDQMRTCAWVLIWISHFKELLPLEDIQQIVISYFESVYIQPNEDFSISDKLIIGIGLDYLELIGKLPETINIADWAIELFVRPVCRDIVEDKSGREIGYLRPSMLAVLRRDKFFLNQQATFNSYAIELNGLRSYYFRQAVRFMPVGEAWFRQSALEPNSGVAGAFLLAFADTILPSLALHLIYQVGFDINKAQGPSLDLWGNYLQLKRRHNESDLSYREKLLALTRIRAFNYNALKEAILQIEPSADVYTLLPYTVVVDGQLVTWSDVSELIEIANTNSPPGVFLTDNSFLPLSDFVGVVYVDYHQTNDVLSEVISSLISSGVDIRYRRLLTFKTNNKSTINYAGSYNYC